MMLPDVFVGFGIGPLFDWAWTVAVIPLRRVLGRHRPSRTAIRYCGEVHFPERIIFPVKQRLRLTGVA
eukprot:10923126-Prorocentrum_lima.AAC.1